MLCRVADYWALSPEEVEKIVEYCIQVDLFNAELYTKYHILTSAKSGNSIIMPVSSWLSIHNH